MAAPGPQPEKTAVGNFGDAFPSSPSGQDAGLTAEPSGGEAPSLEVAEKTDGSAEGVDRAGTVPALSLPHRGDVWAEDGPGPPASTAKDPEWGSAMQGEEEDTGEAGWGPDASSVEAERLLPEGCKEGVEGFMPTGQSEGVWGTEELPVKKDDGQRDYVCLLEEEEEEREEEEDRAPGSEKPEVTVPSCCLQAEDDGGEDDAECPICTERYDQGRHPLALLNCSHALCAQCLRAIMEAASEADIGRVRCPICRQKTPMMEWEICRHQEELMLLSTVPDPASAGRPLASFSPLPARRPGFWGGVEHHFQVRFHTTRMVGFLPCLRYPPRLIRGLARLEGHCRGGYRLALLGLLAAELLSLLLVFLPIVLLLMLFLILDR
uniref:Ring finger protein-like isoform X1 n=1 Tax=Pogona vitticeps TaxID=103695 RepID=A0ABM5F708_9SAUR